MSPFLLLSIYCGLIVLASLAGGWIPRMVRLTHKRMELLVSFVSGVMLGVGLLHLLPHALIQRVELLERAGGTPVPDHTLLDPVMWWLLGGFLVMFLIERFFCYHHHEAPETAQGSTAGRTTRHTLTWSGAAIGLGVHSLVEGVALAASVAHFSGGDLSDGLVGAGVFLAIVLHKPFDALTLGTLAVAGGIPARAHGLLNCVFGLLVPVGAVLFLLLAEGGTGGGPGAAALAAALAFSAGTFLCISLSDLLPELQFHSHDRVKLSIALGLGLAVAAAAGRLEAHAHAGSPGEAQSLTAPDR
jgi:zinc and cadmium transporter